MSEIPLAPRWRGQSREVRAMYRELIEGAIEYRARCLDKPEEYVDYRDDEIPTVAEAEEMCYGCPMRTLCGKYADKAKESYGVWAGKVRTYED